MSSKHSRISKGIWFKGVIEYPSDAQDGDLVYRSDLSKLMFRKSGSWSEVSIGGSSSSGAQTVELYSDSLTTLPTNTSTTIDDITIANDNLVLFSALTAGNNKIYRATVSGASISWVDTGFTSTVGQMVWINSGTVYNDTLVFFDGVWKFFSDMTDKFKNGVILLPSTLPSTPIAGTLFVDSADSNKIKYYNGSSWTALGSGGGSNLLGVEASSGNLEVFTQVKITKIK